MIKKLFNWMRSLGNLERVVEERKDLVVIELNEEGTKRYQELTNLIKERSSFYKGFHVAIDEGLERDLLVAKFTLSEGDKKEDEIYRITKVAERSHRDYIQQALNEINNLKLE